LLTLESDHVTFVIPMPNILPLLTSHSLKKGHSLFLSMHTTKKGTMDTKMIRKTIYLALCAIMLKNGGVSGFTSSSTRGPSAFHHPNHWKQSEKRHSLSHNGQPERNLRRNSGLYSTIDSNDTFMASLRARIQEVNEKSTRLPFIILDTILPRQAMNVTIPCNTLFHELIRSRIINETPYFGMLGMKPSDSGYAMPMETGVQVNIIGKPEVILEADGTVSVKVLLKGSDKQFRIKDQVVTIPPGWMEGRVEFFKSGDDHETISEGASEEEISSDAMARAISKAQLIPNLVSEWISLARTKEQKSGQMDSILSNLGSMPTPDEPNDLSLWVGALINPLPAMGVATEIRPDLLDAKTADERVQIVLDAIQQSIRHMLQGEPLYSKKTI
jgi:hypothetical protein